MVVLLKCSSVPIIILALSAYARKHRLATRSSRRVGLPLSCQGSIFAVSKTSDVYAIWPSRRILLSKCYWNALSSNKIFLGIKTELSPSTTNPYLFSITLKHLQTSAMSATAISRPWPAFSAESPSLSNNGTREDFIPISSRWLDGL